ncbi:unnamed protein product [Moneuplotes crassus]|uniref:Uncharacterized protein n=1 Tax=Euplotes crassus TaxID=5936 RepID=A0AAD1XBX5_EUPCR|nr:unnamed protein product [Moneuplotes crassus]
MLADTYKEFFNCRMNQHLMQPGQAYPDYFPSGGISSGGMPSGGMPSGGMPSGGMPINQMYALPRQDMGHIIRINFYVRGLRPVILHVDKRSDTLDSLKRKISEKLNLQWSLDKILDNFSFYLETGAKVEDIGLLENNDHVLMDDCSDKMKNQSCKREDELERLPPIYMKPKEYYSGFGYNQGNRVYAGYPFHPIPVLFIPDMLPKQRCMELLKSEPKKPQKINENSEISSHQTTTYDYSSTKASPHAPLDLFKSQKNSELFDPNIHIRNSSPLRSNTTQADNNDDNSSRPSKDPCSS